MGFELMRPELTELKPRIAVVGVGGAGGNAVTNMIQSGLQGVDFVVANTDAQALAGSPAEERIQLGLKITQGLGAGSRPEIGRAAAEETIGQLEKALDGAHMCFITAGMGGGTGTGAAPVIAKAARDRGILTVGVVTKPFSFEGSRRMRSAEDGILELQKHVDTLIIIPNQNLFLIANANTTFKEAFAMADQVLHQGVRGITDLMIMPGLINLDFADVRAVMSEMGNAMMGTGEADGDNRAIEAAEKAIANPLLDEVSMKGAKGVIINITGGDDLRLMEVDEAANHIREMVDDDANIIVGSAFNPDLEGKMRVSVVATGIDNSGRAQQPKSRAVTSSGLSTSFSGFGQAPRSEPIPTAGPEPVAATSAQVEEARAADPEAIDELALDAGDIVAAHEPASEPLVSTTPEPASNVMPLYEEPVAEAPEAVRSYVEESIAIEPAVERSEGERPLTLFERMMNISRGAPKADVEQAPPPPVAAASEDRTQDPLEIPRFFRRQVND